MPYRIKLQGKETHWKGCERNLSWIDNITSRCLQWLRKTMDNCSDSRCPASPPRIENRLNQLDQFHCTAQVSHPLLLLRSSFAQCLLSSVKLHQYRRKPKLRDNEKFSDPIKRNLSGAWATYTISSLEERHDLGWQTVWTSRSFNKITLVNRYVVLSANLRKIFHSFSLYTP